MKHNVKITLILVSLFLITQIIGIYTTSKYNSIDNLPFGIERPEVENQTTSFIPIFLMIIFATILGLLMFKHKLFNLWKVWFFITVVITLVISLSIYIGQTLALILALILAFFKIIKRNIFIHNLTEIFIYGALAVIFVPIFNIFSILILLILISIYDYIAVRKTKHMVKLAKSQTEVKTFAGFYIPYKKNTAILGGGDIAFPLLFAAIVIHEMNLNLLNFRTFIIPLTASLSLLALFLLGKEKKYYPAMPYITIGCIAGYLITLII